MASKSLTPFQRRAWLANTLTFALTFAAIMYLGKAFDGDLGFPVAVYVLVVLIVSALLRVYLRDKDEDHLFRLFGGRR